MIPEQVAVIRHFNGIDRSLEPGIYLDCVRSFVTENKIDPNCANTPARSGYLFCLMYHFSGERVITRGN
jgi:hypothetical protein